MSAIDDKSLEIFENIKSKKIDDDEPHVKCKFKF